MSADDFETKTKKEIKHMAKEIKDKTNPAVEEIKEDIDSLRTNVVGLARNIRDIGAERASAAADYVVDQVDGLRAGGAEAMVKAEKSIKAHPAQSVAIAFAAGFLANYIFGRRS